MVTNTGLPNRAFDNAQITRDTGGGGAGGVGVTETFNGTEYRPGDFIRVTVPAEPIRNIVWETDPNWALNPNLRPGLRPEPIRRPEPFVGGIDLNDVLVEPARYTPIRNPAELGYNFFTGVRQRTPNQRKSLSSKSRQRNKAYSSGLLLAFKTGKTIKGRCFSYTLLGGIGTWRVYDHVVVQSKWKVNTVIEITLSVPAGVDSNTLNRVRLLFRRLGFGAKRYRAFTVVESKGWFEVMEQGGTCRVPSESFPEVLPIFRFKDWEQLDLIPETMFVECERLYEEEKEAKRIAEQKAKLDEIKRQLVLEQSKAFRAKPQPPYTKIKSGGFYSNASQANQNQQSLEERARGIFNSQLAGEIYPTGFNNGTFTLGLSNGTSATTTISSGTTFFNPHYYTYNTTTGTTGT